MMSCCSDVGDLGDLCLMTSELFCLASIRGIIPRIVALDKEHTASKKNVVLHEFCEINLYILKSIDERHINRYFTQWVLDSKYV